MNKDGLCNSKVVHMTCLMPRNGKIKKYIPDNKPTLHAMQVILSANKFQNMSNIVDVVVADKNMATMLRGVKAAGLETALSEPGPYTVFAPSEIAFGKLPAGELTELLKPENKAKLTGMLNNHVVEGKKNFKDFTDGEKLKTIDGKELLVKISNGRVLINGAFIQGRDNEASNGVVHSLDAVINAN